MTSEAMDKIKASHIDTKRKLPGERSIVGKIAMMDLIRIRGGRGIAVLLRRDALTPW